MPHKNYFQLEADTHFELGLKKGELFGSSLRADLKRYAKGRSWGRRVARAEPYLDTSRKHFPQLIEELEGYAQGADVALHDLWAWDLDDELEASGRERCTTFVTNNGFLVGHNEDWDPSAADDICVLRRTIGGQSALELYYLHTLGGCAMGVNAQGVVHAVNSLMHKDHGVGVPKGVIARWLSDTDSPQEAVKKLTGIPRASGFHHTFVTTEGDNWSVECSAKRCEAKPLVLPFSHTNHYLSESLAELEKNDDRGGTFERYQHACLSVQPHMSLAEAQSVLGDTSAGRNKSIFNRRTIARAVVDIDHATVYVWLARERDRGWVEYSGLFVH